MYIIIIEDSEMLRYCLKESEKMHGSANSKDLLTEILPFCGLTDGFCKVAQATAIFPKIWTKLVFNKDN